LDANTRPGARAATGFLEPICLGRLAVLYPMFAASLVSLAIAVVAGLFGFGVVSDEAPLAAKLCSAFFLLLALASCWWALIGRAERPARPRPRFTAHDRPSGDRTRLAHERHALPS
jgi:uncharacterized membrane protein YtjA (UPF0391 family)